MAENRLYEVAFPTLTDEQVEKLERCSHATMVHFARGEKLFRVGQREFSFFIVKSGELEILDESGDQVRVVTTHGPGQFTGDVNQLTGSPAVVTCVARQDSDVYQVSSATLRQFLNQCPDLSDVILQAFIARRQLLRESGSFTGLRVIGSRYSQDTFRVRDFLAKNRVLFTWLDLEDHPEVNQMIQQFGFTEADTPIVACAHLLILRNPSNRELADAIGLRRTIEQAIYDLVVVGAGPAGLAAAVYGASEGLRTLVLERTAPGGQAGSSMRIENYLGFPTGLTGSELTDRAVLQANKFGAMMSVSTPVVSLGFDNAYAVLQIDGGESIVAKALLIATGAEYRRLDVEGCSDFEGCGVYYAATPNEAQMCQGAEVVVVGGGNSAGQAAVFLSGHVRRVYVLIRGDDLYKNMSSYLAHRLEQTSNIEILRNTTIQRMSGNGHLDRVEILNHKTQEQRTLQTPAIFSFIGATPRTDWLPSEIERDEKGFVLTGPSLAQSQHWPIKRHPFLLETTRPGVFAAGDVRSSSVKRVASAVGEGAMAVQFVHEYMKGI